MQSKTYRHIGAVAVTLFISVLIFIGTGNLLYAIITFGAILFFYGSGEAFIDYCKMRSTLFYANIGQKGHSSIIEADMFDIQSPHDGEPIYKVMMAGGSSVPYLPFHGFGPCFVCPKVYVKTDFQSSVLAIADWFQVKFDHLPQFFQDALRTRIEHFNPTITEIFFADTSPINEKLKGDIYIDLALRSKNLQAEKNALASQNEDLRVALQSTLNIVNEIKLSRDGYEKSQSRFKYVKVPVNE